MTKFFQNLNDNLLCSIDCETTGTRPREHDIIQLAIIPLNNDVRPSADIFPFLIDMVPIRLQNVQSEAMRINRRKLTDIVNNGIDRYRAQDLFLEWFEKLNLGYQKKIMPLGCNWPFDREFIIDWLGHETYEMCFHPHYRDVQTIASFRNDREGWKGNEFPYPKVSLSYLCTQMRIERHAMHDATDDARVTAEVYRRLLFDWA